MFYYVYMPLRGPFNLDQYNLILSLICVRTGESKFSKQMKKKILSYRIIRIKRIFSGVY